MESAVERGWIVSLSIAAKCGELSADPARLLSLALVVAVCWISTLLLHWASPGGPAWGRYRWRRRRPSGPVHTIPGPRGLPVLGSMALMSGLAHRKLAAAAAAIPGARRLMAFSLGETRVVVTCDPDVARDILNSPNFADRPANESAYGLMFQHSIGFAPYGDYWRALRRISATHLFSPKQVSAFARHRADIAAQMVRALNSRVGAHPIQLRGIMKQAALNHVMWFVFGRQYGLEQDTEETRELRSVVDEGYDLLGKLNWSDHLPIIAGLDLQRVQSRCSQIVRRVDRFVTRIMLDHRLQRAQNPDELPRDFVDVLLSLQGSERLSDSDMVAVLWEMIFRGTDTVAVLMEWVFARLVMHGEVQARVQLELDAVVGRDRGVTDAEGAALPYLQAVIKETLRVHPPGPLMSWARMNTDDAIVGGALVPAGTTAMVNMWAIARDPTVWPDPLRFDPDRFMGAAASEFSVMGSDLRLAPFGAGRRGCPGKGMAMATVELWVAALAHEFEWLPPSDGGAAEGGVDLSEVLRLSCEMASPLTVRLRRRRPALA
ncbi:Cytochrome P450 [Canna indica]|uniref:Cytochrome P450 n=1 Tax=Canna indica TaxID=4628 RepID=A0AAQ3QA99_9LILI|nr:Cytochrome P450 [Canna indica]WOL05257.1 Cytochrome P450 [Canna indica]